MRECAVERQIRRGEIYYADLNPVVGSEQGGERPVLILQNDIGNRYSSTVIVAAVTSRLHKRNLETHVRLNAHLLPKDSIVLLEQIRTIDKARILGYAGSVTESEMVRIENALLISLGMRQRRCNET